MNRLAPLHRLILLRAVLFRALAALSAALAVAVAFPAMGQPGAGDTSGNWPSFRGTHAAGVADGEPLPEQWDAEQGAKIAWKKRIPGLAHSSPIVWRDHVFVTTAVSSEAEATFRHGLYGAGTASEDRSPHSWRLYCLDKRTGRTVWERTAHEGVPRTKRHIKATYANATPATDGRVIVTMMGSEGLFAYDLDGKPLWTKDVGVLDVGAYDAPDYEWGPASSPIIYRDLVIVQCDTQGESFILACDLHSGRTVWRTSRDELPSWGTPTVYESAERPELVTNGSNFIRGYDPLTGEELWRLGGSSKITAPTPIWTDNLIVVCSGRRPNKPLFVIRPGASGDITLEEGTKSSEWVAWSKRGRGSYMPTPVIYRGLLYVCNNNGILTCFDLPTGKKRYRERIPHGGGGFSASPVAGDGKIFLSSEDGDIVVIEAGPQLKVLSRNAMGERLMATPAISDGVIYVRGEKHLFAVAD